MGEEFICTILNLKTLITYFKMNAKNLQLENIGNILYF